MPIPPFTDFHVTFKRRRDAEELRQEVERRRMKERLEEERRKKKEAAEQGPNSIGKTNGLRFSLKNGLRFHFGFCLHYPFLELFITERGV